VLSHQPAKISLLNEQKRPKEWPLLLKQMFQPFGCIVDWLNAAFLNMKIKIVVG
jgi:hypothetical protein